MSRMVKITVPESRADFIGWLAHQDIGTLKYVEALADVIEALDHDDPQAQASAILSRVAAKCPRMLARAVRGVENAMLAGKVAA